MTEQPPRWWITKLDWIVNWARRSSLWMMPFNTACCGIEFMAAAASRFDIARFGMERLGYTPRQADLLIVGGRVPYKIAPVLRRIWDQMPQPKWCIAMGACASTGGFLTPTQSCRESTRSCRSMSMCPAAHRVPRV